MSRKLEQFNPLIKGVNLHTTTEIDEHVRKTPIAYYGISAEPESPLPNRVAFPSITIEDDSGQSEYSILISGELAKAKTILIKPMSVSDHPGRGFEALREVLIADQDMDLVVVGVSFPGAGLDSHGMTHDERRSLLGRNGDFSYISAHQWVAVQTALESEIKRLGVRHELKDYDFVIAGNSQGASNTVGLLQSLPENIAIAGLGLLQDTGLGEGRYVPFMAKYLKSGNVELGKYNDSNAYGNQYPALGPDHSFARNAARHPASHIEANVRAMARGGDILRIIKAAREKELSPEALITLGSASEDPLSSPEVNKMAAEALRSFGLSSRDVVWEGHHHPVLENLSNAQAVFRDLAR